MEKLIKIRDSKWLAVSIIVPVILLISGMLFAILYHAKEKTDSSRHLVGAVLPHHLLVENFIDDFYAILAKQIRPQRIILISPNHFDKGMRYIQTATETPKHEYDNLLDQEAIKYLSSRAGASIENKYYSIEHGIYVHYPFIKKYFPETKIVPIILKRETPQSQLDKLVKDIQDLQKQDAKDTLVLASVDFTHYVSEDIATRNDQRTISYFRQWSSDTDLRKNSKQIFSDLKRLAQTEKEKDPDAVAIDSPESIYVLLNYLNANDIASFQLWRRTSTLSLTKITDSNLNTSHIFGWFL